MPRFIAGLVGSSIGLVLAAVLFVGADPPNNAFYVPYPFEDSPQWSPDPIQWESGYALPCRVTVRHADGTVDVFIPEDAVGKSHVRLRQSVNVPPFGGSDSSVILRKPGS